MTMAVTTMAVMTSSKATKTLRTRGVAAKTPRQTAATPKIRTAKAGRPTMAESTTRAISTTAMTISAAMEDGPRAGAMMATTTARATTAIIIIATLRTAITAAGAGRPRTTESRGITGATIRVIMAGERIMAAK